MVRTKLKKHRLSKILKYELIGETRDDVTKKIPTTIGTTLSMVTNYIDFDYDDLEVICPFESFILISGSFTFRCVSEVNQLSFLMPNKHLKGYIARLPIYCDYTSSGVNIIKIYNKEDLIIEIEWKLRT